MISGRKPSAGFESAGTEPSTDLALPARDVLVLATKSWLVHA